MYGFPTETFEEVKQSINFIKENEDYIHSVSYSFCTPEKHTGLEKKQQELSIHLDNNASDDLMISYGHFGSLSYDELRIIDNELSELASSFQAKEQF